MGKKSSIKLSHSARIAKLKRRKRRFKRIFFTLILLMTVMYTLLFTPTFNTNAIEVLGNEHFTKEDVVNMSGIINGVNIFKISISSAKANILNNSYIENVVITRKYPNKIAIKIVEKKPIAIVITKQGQVLIDKNNNVLDTVTNEKATIKVPIIEGIESGEYTLGKVLNLDVENSYKLENLKLYLNSFYQNGLLGIMSKIIVDKNNRITAFAYEDKLEINFVDTKQMNTKINYLVQVFIPEIEKTKIYNKKLDFTIPNGPSESFR